MTKREASDEIEAIVGVKRYEILHIGRAVSAEQRVFIMHSKACVESGIDLNDCRFSKALDNGIDPQEWDGWEDKPVILDVEDDALVPLGEASDD